MSSALDNIVWEKSVSKPLNYSQNTKYERDDCQVELFTDSWDKYLWCNVLVSSIYLMTASTQPSYPLIHLLAIYRMILMQICKIQCRSLSERYSWYQRLIKYCSNKYSFELKTACMKNNLSYRNMASTDHCKFLKWKGVVQFFCIFLGQTNKLLIFM